MNENPDDVSDRVDEVSGNQAEIQSRQSPEVIGKDSIWPTVIKVLLVLLLVLAIAALMLPQRRGGKGHDQTEVMNNARQIGMALFEFESEFREMPNENTISKVQEKFPSDLKLGSKSSNDFFRQLIASGIVQSESMFHAKISGSQKPDGVINQASALAKKECGFTYFTGISMQIGNPGRPIVASPMIPGTDRFDPKPFDGKAVVLRADNSVTSLPIQKDGRVFIHGRNIMDPSHPIWEGKPPMIAWPEM